MTKQCIVQSSIMPYEKKTREIEHIPNAKTVYFIINSTMTSTTTAKKMVYDETQHQNTKMKCITTILKLYPVLNGSRFSVI